MKPINESALHLAAEHGCVKMMEYLLACNMDVNSQNFQRHRTPLHIAVKNDNLYMAQNLLYQHANVNAISDDQLTALHIAVANRSLVMVKLLLYHGAGVNPETKFLDKTPLFMAVEYDCLDIADILSAHGASIQDGTIRSTTLFDMARRMGNERMTVLLLNYAIERYESNYEVSRGAFSIAYDKRTYFQSTDKPGRNRRSLMRYTA